MSAISHGTAPFAVRTHAHDFSDVPAGRGSHFYAAAMRGQGSAFVLQGCQIAGLPVPLIHEPTPVLRWASMMDIAPAPNGRPKTKLKSPSNKKGPVAAPATFRIVAFLRSRR